MLKRFLPVQTSFFDLFEKTADLLVLTANEYLQLLQNAQNSQPAVDAIANYEKEADLIAHLTFGLLHKTFITPFDRHDIHQLTSLLDDILDSINRCAQRFPFYHLETLPSELIEMGELIIKCSVLLKKALYTLKNLGKSDEIIRHCEELDELESKAHILVLAGEKDLYLNENDFKQFYKLKEIFSRTKSVINSCQDVANIIKGIVLEYS
jgi:uncharacterized protein Yka (UPF0111/DUF47 family)